MKWQYNKMLYSTMLDEIKKEGYHFCTLDKQNCTIILLGGCPKLQTVMESLCGLITAPRESEGVHRPSWEGENLPV